MVCPANPEDQPAADADGNPTAALTARLLKRLTTRYDRVEDRVALHGDCGGGEVHTVWITRRFADALVGELLTQLQPITADDAGAGLPEQRVVAEQGFRQQAARQAQKRESAPPVTVDSASTHREWLAVGAGARRKGEQLRLSLRGKSQDCAVAVDLSSVRLRQWLNVLIALYAQAGWSLDPWPAWMREQLEDNGDTPAASGSLH